MGRKAAQETAEVFPTVLNRSSAFMAPRAGSCGIGEALSEKRQTRQEAKQLACSLGLCIGLIIVFLNLQIRFPPVGSFSQKQTNKQKYIFL